VSERSWLDGLCKKLIEDPKEYVPIYSSLVLDQYLSQQHGKMMELSKRASLVYLDNFPSEQLSEFLRHLSIDTSDKNLSPSEIKLLIEKRRGSVPRFYGIPKIHKTPVKVRPIIPCHSAVQNPAAKFVSKELKPFIKAAPTLIHSSKDLAIKLSKLNLHNQARYYIVTGDVVAFYPNIPVDKCIEIIDDLIFEAWLGRFAPQGSSIEQIRQLVNTDPNCEALLNKYRLFHGCLNVAVKNLITRYGDNWYRQARGLAMGVACSPDLANLYGAFFEEKAGVVHHPQIPFYGRFIDDCLALVFASSEQEALDLMKSTIHYDGCEIEWNVSASHAPFLDMLLFRHTDGSLQHMPYRKARNHMERIPWISYHPEDVKRGTFVGEMSRLATLSSMKQFYDEAMLSLCGLYIKRGYPEDKIRYWLKANYQERWDKRLSESKPAQEGLLVLKSEFNPAWNYFNARELGDAVIGTWRSWLEAADATDWRRSKYGMTNSSHEGLSDVDPRYLTVWETDDGPVAMPDIRKIGFDQKRFLVSRKRTRNLFDLTNLWKKTVFTRLDQAVVAEQREETAAEASDPEGDDDFGTAIFSEDDYRSPPPLPVASTSAMTLDDNETVRYVNRKSPPTEMEARFFAF
jgi:hypothetical protein